MRHKIIMVYPQLGMSGSFVMHAPIGLLYAASRLVRRGMEVVVFDARLHGRNWKERLGELLNGETLAVGVSVMTGKPVRSAMEIGEFVKQADPGIKVVWGGPFATFHPEYILRDDPNCDFAVSGYGAVPFERLVDCMLEGRTPEDVPGVFYRQDGGTRFTPADWSRHEFIDWRDIPYQLIGNYDVYGQLDQGRRIFSLYSAMGCVYKCAFCSSPALYRKIEGKTWVPMPTLEVVDHIQHVVERYGAEYIYFIDDDSFVNLDHVEALIDEINRRGISVKLGFRGARINEIKRMSHEFLDKLSAAGTDILHVGAESGSDAMLKLVRKDCTAQDILDINRKLAAHPDIFVFYNFIIGLPNETMQDLKATAALMLRLIEEHPRCIIGTPNMFRPLPGTELFEVARKEWGYEPPARLQDYAEVEVEGEFKVSWFSEQKKRFYQMLLITSYFVDDKITKMGTGDSTFYRIMRVLSRTYAPVARFRLRTGFTGLFIEGAMYRLASRLMRGSSHAGKAD